MGGVVARVALRRVRAHRRLLPDDRDHVGLEDLHDRLARRHGQRQHDLAELPPLGTDRELDLVLQVPVRCRHRVERVADVGQRRVRRHALREADVEDQRADVGHDVGPAQLQLPPAAADDGADVHPGQAGQVGIRLAGDLHRLERLHHARRLADRIDAVLHPRDVRRPAEDVHGQLHHAGVLRDDVLRAVRLRHDRHVRAHARPEHVDGADAALELAVDAGDDHVAAEPPRAAGGDGAHHHRGDPALHVVDPGAVEAVALDRRRPRVAHPASRDRVDVDVAVQHQAPPAARPPPPTDRLEASRVDLLQLGLEPLAVEERVEETGHLALIGGVARDVHEVLREGDHLVGNDLGQDRILERACHDVSPLRG